ncbi:unnamed protein product [Ceutorhynchus assimilis]|uniref:Uncharacterized protein n=1 Tax=Ceutorhynchus assimilis TaxID=467358 RepID=A0A9N9MIQ5_9CUCU|nr:unnamed protein product [Ceutorhynchus assimilis]
MFNLSGSGVLHLGVKGLNHYKYDKINVTLSYFVVLVQSIDEHRPKKKEKRQLDYALSQHYAGPHSYRLERRISNGPPPFYSQSQYHPGPPRPYRKGRPQSLPAPPYAVQMEPLIHYSQRDPLYDTNTLPPDIDPGQDLAAQDHDGVDRGGSGDTIYIPHKPLIKYIEKPVYIKEPEPIIEIIIKESNVTLPPPPTEAPPPPQKKKKEEVQVFYVKYKKNPNGYGKDAVIYDKPIPAISPQVPEEEEPEPEEEWKDTPPATGYGGYGEYSNEVTEPPKPSTTLRTIIKPDSEVYHSPGNNVKVTFGKEGFDYDKRSSKPEDYPGPPQSQPGDQYPKARQLTSYSDVYFKRPTYNNNYQSSSNEYRSEVRPPQSYRPFNSYSPPSNQYNSRPPNREFNNRPPPFFPPPKYSKSSSSSQPAPSASSRPSFPNFSHSISHPPPPQYQPQPKPVSSNNNNYPPQRFQSQFSDVLPPSQRKPVPYTPFEKIRPSFNNHPPPTQATNHHQLPHVSQNIQFRPEPQYNHQQQQLPLNRSPPSFAEVNNQFKFIDQQQQNYNNLQQQNYNNQQQQQQQQQQSVQNIVPPGGQLIHSLPKYEQHLVVDQATGQVAQSLPLQQQQQQQIHQQESRANKQVKQNHAQYYRQLPSNQNVANHRSEQQSTTR